ncbi:MAG TPA: SDR family oxidoreductase [Pseudomonadales bacterium]|nr:SDR family oxidoreductase [Pseudomonadales bacterium]
MIDYSGKVALVTGAASGIGKALAQALHARGAAVVLADIDEAGVNAAAADIAGASVIACDLANPSVPAALVEQAFDWKGRLDLICSNAGIGGSRKVLEQQIDDAANRLFAVNVFAGLRIVQAYLPLLERTGARGRLMLTGSENSLSVPSAVKGSAIGLYGATKHALLILAEWLRHEARHAPIDLHVLMPGAVYTPLVARALPDPTKAPPQLGLIMPERCAEIALRGMDLGLFYVPTHAHLADDMRPRTEGVAQAIEALGLKKP